MEETCSRGPNRGNRMCLHDLGLCPVLLCIPWLAMLQPRWRFSFSGTPSSFLTRGLRSGYSCCLRMYISFPQAQDLRMAGFSSFPSSSSVITSGHSWPLSRTVTPQAPPSQAAHLSFFSWSIWNDLIRITIFSLHNHYASELFYSFWFYTCMSYVNWLI